MDLMVTTKYRLHLRIKKKPPLHAHGGHFLIECFPLGYVMPQLPFRGQFWPFLLTMSVWKSIWMTFCVWWFILGSPQKSRKSDSSLLRSSPYHEWKKMQINLQGCSGSWPSYFQQTYLGWPCKNRNYFESSSTQNSKGSEMFSRTCRLL